MSSVLANNANNMKMKRKSEIDAMKTPRDRQNRPPRSWLGRMGRDGGGSLKLRMRVPRGGPGRRLFTQSQRMVQKNFFSRNGFSDAGTGTIRGSSRAWASQYARRSAAAWDTCGGTAQAQG